ncbi:hypothetical protein Tco_0868607 [Tanacetum coccineum]
MGELTFFLGLQVKQKEDGIFISQDKYVTEILMKFGFTDIKTASTPMETQKPFLKDEDGEEVDVCLYRSMVGSLMYLTSSRLDIMFAMCACARYQVNPKVSHLHVVKRIFRYLKGQPKLGLWYPKDSPFDLVAYTDSDYTGASLDKKSTTGGCQFIGCRLISWQFKKQTVVANSITEAEYNGIGVNAGDSKLMLLGINLLLLGKVNAARHKLTVVRESTDFLPNATIFEELTRMRYEKLSQKLTFYKAFFYPQWKFLIHTFCNTTAWNEFSSTMAYAIICLATNQKFNFSKYIFENMVKNLENVSDKFLMYPRFMQVFLNKQMEGMTSHNRIYVTPSHTKKIFANMRRAEKDFSGRVTSLFPTMVVQAQKEMDEGSAMPTDPHHTPIITQPSSSQPQKKHKSRRPKKKDTQVPQTSVPSDSTNVADEDSMTLKELMEFCTKLQQRVIDLENTKTDQAQEITSLKLRVKKLKKKKGSRTHKLKRLYKIGRSVRIVSSDEASLGDQEDASKQGRNIDDIDADAGINLVSTHFDADTDMFGVLMFGMGARKKHFAAMRAKEKRDKPPTKAQKKNTMSTYLKNMAGYKSNQLKNKSFNDIQKLFDKAMKRVNIFVAIDTESVEGSEVKVEAEIAQESNSKRAGEDLQQESTKKQKVDDDQETAKMKEHIEVVPNEEEVAIDVIPLATKPPSIVDFKILKEGKIKLF